MLSLYAKKYDFDLIKKIDENENKQCSIKIQFAIGRKYKPNTRDKYIEIVLKYNTMEDFPTSILDEYSKKKGTIILNENNICRCDFEFVEICKKYLTPNSNYWIYGKFIEKFKNHYIIVKNHLNQESFNYYVEKQFNDEMDILANLMQNLTIS